MQKFRYPISHPYAVTTNRSGQTLLEAPITLFVVCVITLIVLQLGVWFHGYLMVSTISADLCRMVAADDSIALPLLTSYANDRMQTLGTGSAWRIPGSLEVAIGGDKRTDVSVSVSLKQQPLPLIRSISLGFVPSAVAIRATSHAPGTFFEVVGEPADAPYRYGYVIP